MSLETTQSNRIVIVASCLSAATGILVIIGWLFDVPVLTSVFPGYSTMKINTAIGLLLMGTTMLIIMLASRSNWLLLSVFFSLCIVLLGLVSLIQEVFGIELGLDQLLIKDVASIHTNSPHPGRMSPMTGLCFFLSGIFLFTARSSRLRCKKITQAGLHIVSLISFLAIIGYLFHVPSFYKLSFLSSIALHTAIIFFVFSISASLVNPTLGITGLFTGAGIGNKIARKLFLEIIATILLLTYMRILAERFKLVTVEFGIVLFAVSFILTSLFLVWRAANVLNRLEKKKESAETDLLQISNFLNATPEPLLVVDSQNLIQLANNSAEVTLGYGKGELMGKVVDILIPQRFRKAMAKDKDHIFHGPRIQEWGPERNFFVLKADGTELPVEITFSPFRSASEEYISLSLRDISARIKSDIELKLSNERNRIFVDQAPNALAMFDMSMNYMAASKKWVEDYHLEGKDIIGRSHYELFPEIGDDWKTIHQECLKGAINTCDEIAFERADGSTQWITWDVRPWYISENEIGGILMYTADISHLKEKDEERRKIEYILQRSNEVAKIAHWDIDLRTDEAQWSRTANEIFELPSNFQPNRKTVFEFYKKGANLDRLIAAVDASVESGIPYDLEVEIITAKGTEKWIRVIGEAEFKNGVCQRRFGILQDITSVKEFETALSKTNEELRALFNSSHVSIIGTDTSGIITHFNRGAEQLLQYTPTEVIHIHTPQLIHLPEEIALRSAELSALNNRPIIGFDVFIEQARKGEYDSREWTYVRKDGSLFSVLLVVTAILDMNGTIQGYLGVATDISERKKAEREIKALLDLTKDQNDRLKNFAHIVSHNLRSHTGNFGMLLDLMKEEYPNLRDNEYVQLLDKASSNLQETISNLNEVVLLNNSLDQNTTALNLRLAATAAINNVSILATDAKVAVFNDIDPEIKVIALPAYLDSIILNFITNGIKYKSNDRPGEIRLSASMDSEFVILKIEDNGIGMDLKKIGSKLFGMYKTFHGNSDARGIGLFITKNQIEAIGGKVEVESQLNKGTIFKVYLRYEKD